MAGPSTQPVTITITGTNDAPVLSADAVANHALTEVSGVTAGSAIETVSGSLAFTDVDLTDTHSVGVGAPAVAWSGGAGVPAGTLSALQSALTTTLTTARAPAPARWASASPWPTSWPTSWPPARP